MTAHSSYELFEELGRGANSVVYRAFDLSLGRDVAIKELNETARRDPRHRERFLREAQFLAQFEHENVLRVYSVDTERGWIIVELMQGTLASIIAEGPSDPDLVRSVLQQTLGALAFLHEKSKVHGTVRPTNLLINAAGRVKLSEFEQTAVGGELRVPTGSKKYLAPELIRPEFGEFGPPLDLYCLGFTVLELLMGPQFESLFPGTGKGAIDADMAWLRWHSSPEDLAPAKKMVKGIPDDLAHVLDQMLKKRVADRAQTAQEVLKELADRPFVPVPVAAAADAGDAEGGLAPRPAPAIVRTLAPGQQTVLPPGASSPAATAGGEAAGSQSPPKQKRVAKSTAAGNRRAPVKYSKDWWNQQLGRPYVLYPLCAAILLGALWMTIRMNASGSDAAVPTIPVTFDVAPHGGGVEVFEEEQPLAAAPDGTYAFSPGVHALTFRKAGFHPRKQEIDVSAERTKFAVSLEPVVTFVDVVIEVVPADAELSVGGKSQSLVSGTSTLKHQAGQPLALEARRAGFVAASRSLSADELAALGNKVSLELERVKPRLPESLAAKPGAGVDPDAELPVRVFSTRLEGGAPLEFVLVKAGTYAYGSREKLRDSELPSRSVQIQRPFYISIREVTNAQYQQFFDMAKEEKAGSRWQDASQKWAERLNLEPAANSLPVTNVSSQQAQAFCQWIGGRLPTEIEWESAVRGPDDRGYPLPWGNDEPSPVRCQIFYGELGPVPVEAMTGGASPLGLLHAVGNAAEWCTDSEQRGGFILRGCSFATANIDDVRVTWRRRGDTKGEEDTGFRVVVPIGAGGLVTESNAAMGSTASLAPSVLAPVLMLYQIPWKSFGRDLGLIK
jgi:formylglycine-generating enzyme required for sulfatase activity